MAPTLAVPGLLTANNDRPDLSTGTGQQDIWAILSNRALVLNVSTRRPLDSPWRIFPP